MAGTFASEIAASGGDWWAYLVVEGWGRRTGATTAEKQRAYRFSTLDPDPHGYTAAQSDGYIPALTQVPATLEEQIDLRNGGTLLGQLTFDLLDVPPQVPTGASADGWQTTDMITDLIAVEASGPVGPFALAASVTSSATGWTLDSVAGIAVGDHLWIGSEAVRVTALPGGVAVTVARGVLDTTAQAHNTKAALGEGVVYAHPRYVRARRVKLYINLFDTRTGEAMQEAQARLVWQGVIDEWELVDENAYRIACKPMLGLLDKSVGREQYNSTMKVHTAMAEHPEVGIAAMNNRMLREDFGTNGRAITLAIPESIGGNPVREPQYTPSGSTRKFHARFGDQIVEAHYTKAAGQPAHGEMNLHRFFLAPKGEQLETTSDSELVFRDVLLTHPNPRRDNPAIGDRVAFFPAFGGVPGANPVNILLTLIYSTGTGTNTDWDTLPAHWGAGVPAALVNHQSFRDIEQRLGGLLMPNLVLGWEGEPVRLREWMEAQILGPLGLFFYLDENGLIALGDVSDAYPLASLPNITEADIIDGTAATKGGLGSTITWQTWKFGKGRDGEYKNVHRYRSPQAAERYPDDDSEMTFEVEGFGTYPDAAQPINRRAINFARWWHTPLPRVAVGVGLHRLDISITEGVYLTVGHLPNPFTGTRGFTNQPAVVVGRALNFEEGRLDLELLLLPAVNTGHWAPSGEVTNWDAGTKVATLQANAFTRPDAGDGVPNRDAAAFTVGDKVVLLDSDGAVRSVGAVQPTVSAVGAGNTITLSGDFLDGGGAAVVPVATNVITFLHYSGGATPHAAWTDNMKNYVAQADNANSLLGGTADAGYVYGG